MRLEFPAIRHTYSSLRGLGGGVDAVALLTSTLPASLPNGNTPWTTDRTMTGAEAAQAIVSSLSSKGYIVVDAKSVNLSEPRKAQIAADVKASVFAVLKNPANGKDDIVYANPIAITNAFEKFKGEYSIVQQSDLAVVPSASAPSAPATPGASPAPNAPGTPSGASTPNNASATNASNNPFHFQLPTPYNSGGGRRKTPPSTLQQWLPVGLVIAGVVLVIGFGSYAGRE